MEPLSESYLRSLIAASLEEDLAFGPDVTTLATISADATSRARFVSRAEGVTAGLDVIRYALDTPGCEVTQRVDDGERVAPGNVLAEVTAPTRTLQSVAIPRIVNDLRVLGGRAGMDVVGDNGVLSAYAILAQTRSLIVDLLQVCGMSRVSAAAVLVPTSTSPKYPPEQYS